MNNNIEKRTIILKSEQYYWKLRIIQYEQQYWKTNSNSIWSIILKASNNSIWTIILKNKQLSNLHNNIEKLIIIKYDQ